MDEKRDKIITEEKSTDSATKTSKKENQKKHCNETDILEDPRFASRDSRFPGMSNLKPWQVFPKRPNKSNNEKSYEADDLKAESNDSDVSEDGSDKDGYVDSDAVSDKSSDVAEGDDYTGEENNLDSDNESTVTGKGSSEENFDVEDNPEPRSVDYRPRFSTQQFRLILEDSPPAARNVSPEPSSNRESEEQRNQEDLAVDVLPDETPADKPRFSTQQVRHMLEDSPPTVENEERKEERNQGYLSDYLARQLPWKMLLENSDEDIPPGSSSDEDIPPGSSSDEDILPGSSSDENIQPETNSDENIPPETNSDENIPPETSSDENISPETSSDEEKPESGIKCKRLKLCKNMGNSGQERN